MKKLFLVVAAVVAASVSSANAQVVWGGRVGLSMPTVAAEGESIDGKYGLEIGPTLYYSLKENLYINSGASFSIKSFDVGETTLSSNWISIPVYVGYAIPLGGVQTYAQVGPYIGLKLSEGWSGGSDDYEDDGSQEAFSSFDAGLGIMYGVNINKFKIEAGYQFGLTNVNGSGGSSDIKLSSLFVGISYIF